MKVLLIIILFTPNVIGIYDGFVAERNQYPYLVIVNSPQFYCAGSLITGKHVLTAAHCLMSVSAGDFVNISIGAYSYYGNSKSDGILLRSNKISIHENFSMPAAENDIGIIELLSPVKLSNKVKIIGIDSKPNADLNPVNYQVVVAGWGHTSPGVKAKQLRYTKMKILPFESCKKFKGNYIESLTKNHICATKLGAMPYNACDGDSGTSLVSAKTGRIIGILSYVKDAENGENIWYNDCKSIVPAVSTRISSYYDWIVRKVGGTPLP